MAREVRGPAAAELEIDLGAIAANYALLRERARPAATAAVVKADAYGLGLAPVARTLHAAGCRQFFVARLEEGVALRRLLAEAEIYVLDGVGRGEEETVFAHRLVPVLNHPGELELWSGYARRLARRLPAAIHLDTGMTRLGFSVAAATAVDVEALAPLELRLVMSHLACADEPDHPLNAAQLRRFLDAAARFPGIPRSLAASSGIFLGDAYRFDLCRPGVALYGANPAPGRPNPVRPVVRLVAPVLQVHEIDAPGTVGYGATYPVRPGMRIATLPVGYADGLLRSASNRATARVGGIEVPYAGRVSMDLISLDVTALPAGAVAPGTPVELLGGPEGVDRLAAQAGTIGYEVLTRLGHRFRRRYLASEEPA